MSTNLTSYYFSSPTFWYQSHLFALHLRLTTIPIRLHYLEMIIYFRLNVETYQSSNILTLRKSLEEDLTYICTRLAIKYPGTDNVLLPEKYHLHSFLYRCRSEDLSWDATSNVQCSQDISHLSSQLSRTGHLTDSKHQSLNKHLLITIIEAVTRNAISIYS